ncbi:MAG TPA: PepSY-associated TM helix domain-containing protein [Verrucomicrobiae bacterium]|nr:PepSY-associated TM helix domain-containing protein [Verrucomicrobiae bacterium]
MNLHRLNSNLHRDIGYFLSGLILVYCISGIALNHLDDWNPDFVIHKQTITLYRTFTAEEVTSQRLAEFSKLVGETAPKVHDFPTPHQVKIYYDNASLLIDLQSGIGIYESVQRRPLFYHLNLLHRNTVKGWRWAADVFGVLLIGLTLSGWFILKGNNGIMGRGKWLVLAGVLPPITAWLFFALLQK